MREDLIEALTRLLFSVKMSNVIVALCRLCTKEEERVLAMKMNELAKIKPKQLGLNDYFTLDKSSSIWKVFATQFKMAH